ncbi:polysaccharide deacetylase [Alphaproteobacteria bacterium]|nr:polysaccharide deacetylase [Alphaproteobacteria bacterium]
MRGLCAIFLAGCLAACASAAGTAPAASPGLPAASFWGEHGAGIADRLDGGAIYLTLDACGSKGDGYDSELIEFLRAQAIPATLFVNIRWIDQHPSEFARLAADPLFKIASHGMRHLPASTTGRSAYGIAGAADPAALALEVRDAADRIEAATGVRPTWYRSGTAFYDGRAVGLVTRDWGLKIAGYAIAADEGSTLPAKRVEAKTLKAKPGDIILAHMNRPTGQTYEGLRPALLALKARGAAFAKLPD